VSAKCVSAGTAEYAVAPDDRRFLMIRQAVSAPDELVVVDNWFEELKSKFDRQL
jgi:hypothetical protein